MRFVRASSCLFLGLLLAGEASAQRARSGFDPTTGRFGTLLPRGRQDGKPTAPRGEVIGYTALGGGLPMAPGHSLVELGAAAADLVADGHTLVPILRLTPEALQGIDRLVVGLTTVERAFAEPDVDVVEDFVLGGGKLVFLGENNAFFRAGNVAVGGRFGIVYPTVDPQEERLDDVTPHPLTRGAFGSVRVLDGRTNGPLGFGSMLPGPHGTSLVRFSDGTSAVVLIEPNRLGPGSGVVVAFADINLFVQDYALADNRALWRNAFLHGGTFTLDFETEDDFVAPLWNGRSLVAAPGFGRLVTLTSGGWNAGAAIFDSTPGGPNSGGQDRDLLVGRGKLLILQDGQVPGQSVPATFDRPDDDADGGRLSFVFPEPVQALELTLVDIDAGTLQAASVTLVDVAGRQRVYDVPPSWTEDLLSDGPPAWRRLDLGSLAPQPGFLAPATVTQTAGFDARNVLRLEVRLGSSGAVDDLSFARFCGPH